jgi:hypothetical protein
MSSTTEICNRAITKLGDQRILSLTDNTNQGRTLASMYAPVRDAELRRNRWNFAIRRAALPALADAPEWGYSRQFQVPNDFMSLVQVNDVYIRPRSKAKGPWSLEAGRILTDMGAPLKVRYVARIENSGLFDPLFVEMLACKLAFEACESLTQSGQKKQALAEEYKMALSEAARSDAIENPPDELPRGSWLDARENTDYLGGDAYGSGYMFPAGTPIDGGGGLPGIPGLPGAGGDTTGSVYAINYAIDYA